MRQGFPIHVVDAFTDRPFAGNPAAVVVMDQDRDNEWMRLVAAEMRHSETAFVDIRDESKPLPLRWFSPTIETKLCGHATLATAHVLGGRRTFTTLSGELHCESSADGWISLDFPIDPIVPRDIDDIIVAAASLPVEEAWMSELGKAIAVVKSAEDIRKLKVDKQAMAAIGRLIITAPSDRDDVDFVSRYFGPAAGIDEDPVTGSAHCALAALWGPRLSKTDLAGEQASERGGIVRMEVEGNRVRLRGQATTVLSGTLQI